jgi:hypothetical protein
MHRSEGPKSTTRVKIPVEREIRAGPCTLRGTWEVICKDV